VRGARRQGSRKGSERGREILIKKRGDSGRELIVRAYCLLFVDASQRGKLIIRHGACAWITNFYALDTHAKD